jgi:hypothetical protein
MGLGGAVGCLISFPGLMILPEADQNEKNNQKQAP